MSRRYVMCRDVDDLREYWRGDHYLAEPWSALLSDAKRYDAGDIERGPEMKPPAAFWLPLRPKGAPQHRCHWHAEFIRVLRDRDELGAIANSAVTELDEARAARDVALDDVRELKARIAELEGEVAAYRKASGCVRVDAPANARRAAIEECRDIVGRTSSNGNVADYVERVWKKVNALLDAPPGEDGKDARITELEGKLADAENELQLFIAARKEDGGPDARIVELQAERNAANAAPPDSSDCLPTPGDPMDITHILVRARANARLATLEECLAITTRERYSTDARRHMCELIEAARAALRIEKADDGEVKP